MIDHGPVMGTTFDSLRKGLNPAAFWFCFLSTRSPLVPYFMRAPPLQVGSVPCVLGRSCFRWGLGWFRRFRPPPPPPVWVCFRRPPLFLFPCLFRVRPLRARCVGVGVFSWFLLFFLCVPVSRFLLSIFIFISCASCSCSHLHVLVILIFTSLSGPQLLSPPSGGVCVWNIWTDVKLLNCFFTLQGDTAFHWDCVQQSYPWIGLKWDIQLGQLDVPALFEFPRSNGDRLSLQPDIWFCYCTAFAIWRLFLYRLSGSLSTHFSPFQNAELWLDLFNLGFISPFLFTSWTSRGVRRRGLFII